MIRSIILLVMLLLMSSLPALGAYLENVPQTITQPNGEILKCLASGDEFNNWKHDENGYTLVRDESSGFWVYADKINDELKPTALVFGKDDPRTNGLTPWNMISKKAYLEERQYYYDKVAALGNPKEKAPTIGTMNNICIFIRFSDDPEFTNDRSTWDFHFNSDGSSSNSMRNFFHKASYNQLSVFTHMYPPSSYDTNICYVDSHPRAYFQPYDAVTNPTGYDDRDSRIAREHKLLKNAIEFVRDDIAISVPVDLDYDGYVDNVIFIIQGDPDGWNDLLWPHEWELFSYTVKIRDYTVKNYNVNMETRASIGTMCHEMSHTLGAPDYYHYNDPYKYINPVGKWDIMDNNTNPPQHHSAHTKYKYFNWITDIPTITTAGTYTLHPLTDSTNNCYKVYETDQTDEYWVIEYRKTDSMFEASLPGEGLLVFRVNPDIDGNAGGPPDELYVYRPGGTPTLDGVINQAPFSADSGKYAINRGTDPACYLNNGALAELFIADIDSIGETISFFVSPSLEIYSGTCSDGTSGPITTASGANLARSDLIVPSGHTLTIENGAFLYSNPDQILTVLGTCNVESGSAWTRLFSTGGYRRGILSRGEIKILNGGEISFK